MKTFYAFKNVDNQEEAEISIFDEIGFWGSNAKNFYAQLKAIKAKKIVLRINSPGGSVVDGYAIYNMLRSHSATKEVRVDGIAASIASVIAMAGDTIVMPENALMFIHDPLVYSGGNAEELRKLADELDKLKEGILSIYEARSGSDRAKISKMMAEETLLTAKEARALGFADTVVPEQKIAAKFDVDCFPTDVKDRVAAMLNKQFPPSTVPGGQNNKEKTDMTLDEAQAQITSLTAENSRLKTVSAENATKAHQEAVNKTTEQEKSRKKDILALRDKYNKDGDLDDLSVKALAADTTPDQFKDQVMEVINNRATKPAIKKGADAGNNSDFETRYKNAKTAAERRQLVRENRVEARQLSRG